MDRRAKGTGYLISNADGSKTLRQSVTDPKTGKTKRIQVTADNETACHKLMKKRLKEIDKQAEQMCNSPRITVTQLCNNYLNSRYSQGLVKRTTKDRTQQTIDNQIAKFKLGRLQIASVTTADVENFFKNHLENRTLSISSIEKALYILDPAFKWAVSRKELPFNPIDPIRTDLKNRFSNLTAKSADDEDVRIMTQEEKDLVYQISRTKWNNGEYRYTGGIYFRFLVETGMRVGEFIALRWKDYDFKNHILRVDKTRHQVRVDESDNIDTDVKSITHEGDTKNSKARNIELLPKAIETIEEIYRLSDKTGLDDFICLNQVNKNHTDTSLESVVNKLYKKAGINDHISGLHVLRRTFATELFDSGYTSKEVAAYLGDDESTVNRYYIAARKTREIDGKRIAVVSLRRDTNN